MKAGEILNTWLSNPRRKYSEGLTIFNAMATLALKNKYSKYLNDADPDIQNQFSLQMSVLTNKLAQISNMMVVNPDLFKDVNIVTVGVNKAVEADIQNKTKVIDDLKATKKELEDKLEVTEGENEVLTEELDEARTELEEVTEQIDELNKEVKSLKKKRGLEIVSENDLPENIQKLYKRNKEITPVMASIHAEISMAKITIARRKKLVKQLCELDDERRANWDVIDDWSEGKNYQPVEPKKPVYNTDPVVAGLQMARRIERLKENILNCQKTIDAADRDLIRDNASHRLQQYKDELAQLENYIKKAEGKNNAE